MTTLMEFSRHPLVHALGWTLLHFLWQGTLAALVLWLVLGFLGGRSSKARYGAACVALALMVAMPMITFARIASAEYKTRRQIQQSAIAIDSGMLLMVGIGEPAPPWPAKIAMALDRKVPWILTAWFVGAIFFVVRLNLGMIVARRLKHAGTQAPPPELQHLFDELKLRIGVARAVSLLHSARVQVPTVIGWLRPVVLIPASCLTGLSTLQIEAILCHELAHVRRHDYLVSVFQSIAEALLFYHPAIWWVSKQVRRERECCCDEVAVGNGGDVLAYAKALSYLEEQRAAYPEFVLGANGGVLKMRIKRLLGCSEDAQSSQFAVLTLVALIVAVAGSYLVSVARAQPKIAQSAPTSIAASGSAQPQPASLTQTSIAQTSRPSHSTIDWGAPAGAGSQTSDSRTGEFAARIMAPRRVGFQPQAAVTQSAAQAGHGEGAITGIVVDPTGALVPRATVRATTTDLHFTMVKTTDNSGTYSLSPLPAGRYNVEVIANGFQPLIQPSVSIDVSQKVALNLKLKVGAIDESLTVAATPSMAPVPPPPVDIPKAKPGLPLRVSAGTMAGNIISRVDPVYPPDAKAAHLQGVVVLRATISKLGTIENLQVVSGPPPLLVSSIDAVRQWKYKPYLLNGEPTEVETTININYRLADTPEPAEQNPATTASPEPGKIGGGVSPPIVIHAAQPEYTSAARKAKTSGTVLVNLTVDEQGRPQHVNVLRGVGNGLDKKAVEAVKQYRFKPAMKDEKPVQQTLNVEVNFQIF